MPTQNLVFGNYVTSATFCLKLGKREIDTLSRLSQHDITVRDGTDPALRSLSAKGLISTDDTRFVRLTDAGKCAVALLEIAGLIAVPAQSTQRAA